MIKRFWNWLTLGWTVNSLGTIVHRQLPAAPVVTKRTRKQLAAALMKARAGAKPPKSYVYEIKAPELPAGVVPKETLAPALAMDSAEYGNAYSYARGMQGYGIDWSGFPGYPYLAMLSTRAEYRMFAQAMSTALTREWIVLNSTDTAGDSTRQRITELTQAIKDLGLRDVIRLAAEHDSYYGRAQIFLDLDGQDRELPLILDPKTIKKGTKFKISAVEAMWTTPSVYNAIDPGAPNFYKPSGWFMLGKQVHANRLLTIITRPVTDMLKPAFNFGGMSMSQLAEPYVDNWLRTRQSVSDLINNFSITALATSMDAVLQGTEGPSGDGTDLFERAELFTLGRSNKGLMLLDKDKEELVQVNTPLSGLNELQSQSQEQMCSVSHTPSVILLGIAPSGFGNVAEGELRTWNDWVMAIWEAYWRTPIETIIQILQLTMFGEIDPDIIITPQPLFQMTPKELAEIRTADANTDAAYLDRGVVDPIEVREKLARDPESGYQGLDITKVPDNDQSQLEENQDVP